MLGLGVIGVVLAPAIMVENLTSLFREAVLDYERFEREYEEGTLWEKNFSTAMDRMTFNGTLQAYINALFGGFGWYKDFSATLIGMDVGYLSSQMSQLGAAFRDWGKQAKTNAPAREVVKDTYRLAILPSVAIFAAAKLPQLMGRAGVGGRIAVWVAQQVLTSQTAASALADVTVGP